MSPEGTTLAYTEQQPRAQLRVVVGDRPGPPISALEGRIMFSPDSKRHAYVAKMGATKVVVVDGMGGPAFDSIDGVRFSADSKHVAYTAVKAGVHHVVVNQAVRAQGFAWASPPQFEGTSSAVTFVGQVDRNFSRRRIAVER